MLVTDLKTHAKRLGVHLATHHGVRLKHSALLEAVAAIHGARDWNTLAAQSKPGLLQNMVAALSPSPKLNVWWTPQEMMEALDEKSYILGLNEKGDGYVRLSHSDVCTHSLLSGRVGSGCGALIESLLAQQVAKGGGLLFFEDYSNMQITEALKGTAAALGRLSDVQIVSIGDAVDLRQVRAERRILCVQLQAYPDMARTQGLAILEQLWDSLLPNPETQQSPDERLPFLVAVPHVQRLLTERWSTAMAQARAGGVALLLHSQDWRSFSVEGGDLALAVVANTRLKVFFKEHLEPEDTWQPQALDRATIVPGWAAIKEQLSGLPVTTGFATSPNETRKINNVLLDIRGLRKSTLLP